VIVNSESQALLRASFIDLPQNIAGGITRDIPGSQQAGAPNRVVQIAIVFDRRGLPAAGSRMRLSRRRIFFE
jgi:hypothetical protein